MQQFFEWLHSLFTWQLWPFSAERIFWCLFHCYSFMLVFICELIWFPFPRSELPVSVFYCEMFLRVTQSRSRREPSSSSSSSHLTCQNDIFIQSIWCFCSARLHDGHVSDDWIFKRWEWMIFQPHDASCEESIIRSGTTTATVGSLTEPLQKLSQVY